MKPPRRWGLGPDPLDKWEFDIVEDPKGNYVLYEDYIAMVRHLSGLMMSAGFETAEQILAIAKVKEAIAADHAKRIAKRKPTAKATPKTGWRKMSTAPLGTPIEVRFAGIGADIRWRTVTATLDEYGFYIGKVYWARFTTFGHDRLDDWRPLSK